MTPDTRRLRHTSCALAMLAFTGAAAALPGAAQAQRAPLPENGWSMRLGAGAAIGPAYPGSETTQFSPFPLVDLAYRPALPLLDTVFLNARDGLGVVALRQGPFSIGGSIGYAPGRDQDVAARLQGMGDIEAAARANLFLRADFGQFGLSVEAARALGDQEGTTLTFGASLRQPVGPRLMLLGRVEATWADEDHMQQWFGVTSQQASRSRFAAYNAEAGFRSVSGSLTAIYSLSDRWSLSGSAGVAQLLGDAADSPITESKTQPFGLVGVTYRF
ncbi:MipA/OmpV family protein [Roseomonas sp. F4]